MNTAEVLRKARALIDRPEKWTQRRFAENAAGETVDFDDPDAVKFCAAGAIGRSEESILMFASDSASYRTLSRLVGAEQNRLSEWNDAPERTHAEVLEAFDKAIAIAESSHE